MDIGTNKSDALPAEANMTESSACVTASQILPGPLVMTAEEQMFTNLSQTDAHFKHQQIGEPDLTVKEKYLVAEKIFAESRYSFLIKFHKYLQLQDIQCFNKLDDCHKYEVDFYLDEIRKRHDVDKQSSKTKNRRYQALQRLKKSTSYFSEDEMEQRDPLLYEQLVGQFLSAAERAVKQKQRCRNSDLKMSTMILNQLDDSRVSEYKNMQELSEKFESTAGDDKKGLSLNGGGVESDESELDSDAEDVGEKRESGSGGTGYYFNYKEPEWSPNVMEKETMRVEFREAMEGRFLRGEDDYDYTEIDGNDDYDSLDIVERDEQERYFDHDDDIDTSQPDTDITDHSTAGNDTTEYDY